MNTEQMKHLFDVLAESTRRWSLARDIAQHYKTAFEAQVRAYGQAQKRNREKMRPEMAMCWLVMRGSMRCQQNYYADMEQARENLEHALLELGQRLGERLPEQYQGSERNSAL